MEPPQNNSKAIMIVISTVCILAFICVVTQAMCAFWKIPAMSDNLSTGFTHISDTLIGALIALLINTRSQETRRDAPPSVTPAGTPSDPVSTVVTNKPSDPVPTTEAKPQ